MKTIHKFPLARLSEVTVFDWPVGAKVLYVGVLREHPCVWVMLDTDEQQTAVRRIRVVGTGLPVAKEADEHNYLGTILLLSGDLVLHVFDVDKDRA